MLVLFSLFLFLFLVLSVFLCLVILVQESKSSGFGASFGGEGGESLFGTSTPAILKKITAYLSVVFLVGSVVLSLWTGAMGQPKKTTTPTEIIEP